jgi:hypothetical protein
MSRKQWNRCWRIVAIGAAFAAGTVSLQVRTRAQNSTGLQPGTQRSPAATLTGDTPADRTEEAIQADEQSGTFTAGQQPAFARLRPTLSDADYASTKAALNVNLRMGFVGAKPATLTGVFGPPSSQGVNFNGSSQDVAPNPCGCWPPDTHGAVGRTQYVQIINSVVNVYNKTTGALAKHTALNTLMGTTTFLYDPRALYDRRWNRWVLTADGSSNANPSLLYLAISKTASPTGAWWIYALNVGGTGEFWDYPDVGMDIDSIMITFNQFNTTTNGFDGSALFAVDKALLYNGLGFTVPLWTTPPDEGTLAPPNVLDDEGQSVLLAAPPGGSNVYMWRLRNSGRAFSQNFTFGGGIPVPAYTVPPSAVQPGTTQVLDTLDGRFQNASGQIGKYIYQVHTINLAGFAAPEWYRFDFNAATLDSSDVWFASGTSHDFNPSVAIDSAQRMYVTWSSTDPPLGAAGNPQVRASGKLLTDANIGAPHVVLVTSVAPLTGNFDSSIGAQRWGDYSSVSVDPVTTTGAGNPMVYVTNERSLGSKWGTRIGRIGY